MGRGYKSSRDLSYRLPKNVPILHKIGDVIRKAKYTGTQNNVKYRGIIMTVNQFCRFVRQDIRGDSKKTNINVWANAYVKMKNKKGSFQPYLLKDVPILSKYKKYENDILNNTYLKEKTNNDNTSKDININMPRKKTQVKLKTQKETELERRLREYDIRMTEWWQSQNKDIIEDSDMFTRIVFATRKLKGYDNVYEMLNQNKQRIGIIHPWIDKNGKYPPQFKNDENVVCPMGIPEYEYLLDKDSPFHEMPKSTYYKYKFTKVFNKFILTDEIRTYDPSE